MIRHLFAAAGLLAVMSLGPNQRADAQLQPGICVVEFVTASVGGATTTTYNCEARQKFTVPQITGQPCTPPANGITLYAKLPDGTCLPITPVAAPGFVADKLEFWYEHDTNGGYYAQSTFAMLTPKP